MRLDVVGSSQVRLGETLKILNAEEIDLLCLINNFAVAVFDWRVLRYFRTNSIAEMLQYFLHRNTLANMHCINYYYHYLLRLYQLLFVPTLEL